ncbi:MAG: RNA polymerase sigma factor [Candidatus Poribacteria bacterium]
MQDKDKDKFLVERFQQGDNEAFDELVRKYQNKIYELAYRFTHNVEDALDLSQEIFLRAFKSLGGFKGESNFYTWLYRIAQNLCIDYTRHKKVSLKTVAFPADTSSPKYVLTGATYISPDKLVEAKELENAIARAIDMLPSRKRSVFILRYYEGLDLKSIAEILGCRVGTVKAHLSYGRRMLKKMLSPYLGK